MKLRDALKTLEALEAQLSEANAEGQYSAEVESIQRIISYFDYDPRVTVRCVIVVVCLLTGLLALLTMLVGVTFGFMGQVSMASTLLFYAALSAIICMAGGYVIKR